MSDLISPLKISYITSYDATNILNWSGLGYFIGRSLKNQKAELDQIGGVKTFHYPDLIFKKLIHKSQGRTFPINRNLKMVSNFAKQVQNRIKPDSNLVFSPGSVPISMIETHLPKVFYTDACFAGMIDFYEGFSTLSAESLKDGHFLEQKALSECKLVLYSSEWAAQSAIDNYQVDPSKIKVVPFGANLDFFPTPEESRAIVKNRSDSICKLLFIGVEWKRKGGDLALEVATEMNRRGIKTELHVVGLRNIPLKRIPPFLINHGFLNKAIPAQKIKLERLLTDSHFLLVPSKAEAFGVVFAEASAWAIPSVSFHLGGIPTAVKNGLNGHLFSPEAGVIEFSDYLSDLFTDTVRYNNLANSSFNEFQTRLNWDVSGKTIMKYLREL